MNDIVKVYRPEYNDTFFYSICRDTSIREGNRWRIVNLTSKTILTTYFSSKEEAYDFLFKNSNWECKSLQKEQVINFGV